MLIFPREQNGLKKTARLIYPLALIAFCLYPVYPQSIAESLGSYQLKLERDVIEATSTSFSGVSFHSPSENLFVVDDGGVIWEMDVSGNIIRELPLSGFDDTEGIAHQNGNFFLIVEERLANVHKIEIPETGTETVTPISGAFLTLGPNMGNTGLEGVSFLQDVNKAYAVKEMTPSILYEISFDENGNPESFAENTPFSILNISGDAADILALPDGYFLLLSQEENILYGYGPDGNILSQLELGLTKPEGVSWNPESREIYIVGEPHEYAVFENPQSNSILFPPGYSSDKRLFNLTPSLDGHVYLPFEIHDNRVSILSIYLADGQLLEKLTLNPLPHSKAKIPWKPQTKAAMYWGVLR